MMSGTCAVGVVVDEDLASQQLQSRKIEVKSADADTDLIRGLEAPPFLEVREGILVISLPSHWAPKVAQLIELKTRLAAALADYDGGIRRLCEDLERIANGAEERPALASLCPKAIEVLNGFAGQIQKSANNCWQSICSHDSQGVVGRLATQSRLEYEAQRFMNMEPKYIMKFLINELWKAELPFELEPLNQLIWRLRDNLKTMISDRYMYLGRLPGIIAGIEADLAVARQGVPEEFQNATEIPRTSIAVTEFVRATEALNALTEANLPAGLVGNAAGLWRAAREAGLTNADLVNEAAGARLTLKRTEEQVARSVLAGAHLTMDAVPTLIADHRLLSKAELTSDRFVPAAEADKALTRAGLEPDQVEEAAACRIAVANGLNIRLRDNGKVRSPINLQRAIRATIRNPNSGGNFARPSIKSARAGGVSLRSGKRKKIGAKSRKKAARRRPQAAQEL